MADPNKKKLGKQPSLSYMEQSLNMITPPQAPVTIYPGPKGSLSTLSKVDLELVSRLQKLKQDVPSEDEMAVRLAQLKDLPPDYYRKDAKPLYCPPDTRSSSEKSSDLISQIMQEIKLESMIPDPDDELQRRLANLKGEEYKTNKPTPCVQPVLESSIPEDKHVDIDEVEELMRSEASASMNEAQEGISSLKNDPQVSEAIAQALRERDKTLKEKRSKDPEKYSDSDNDSEPPETTGADVDKQEVDRIVAMYMDRAEKKRKKKKLRKHADSDEISDDSSSSSNVSSAELTSDEEKFSSDLDN